MAGTKLPANRWALDSSVIIAHLNGAEVGSDRSRDLIIRAEAGEATLFVSSLAMVEVRKPPRKSGLGAVADNDAIDSFFQKRCVTVVELDRTTARIARDLCESHGLPSWDAVHVASAIRSRADVLFSWDNDDLVSRKSIGSLQIRNPYHIVKKSEVGEKGVEQASLLEGIATPHDPGHS